VLGIIINIAPLV